MRNTFSRYMILYALHGSKKYFVREEVPQRTLPCAIALALPPLIRQNLICCLNGLFHPPVMSRRTLMWILNTRDAKKSCNTFIRNTVVTVQPLSLPLHNYIIKEQSVMWAKPWGYR